MLRDFFQGLNSYQDAYQALSKYKLWSYVIWPGLISLAVAIGVAAWAISYADDIGQWAIDVYPWDWGQETVGSILSWLAGILMVIVALFTYRYLVMIIGSPFMSLLSEKLESQMTGRPAPEVSLGEMIKDVIRGLRIALRNIFWELFLTLLLTIAGFFVPVVGNAVATVLIFLVQGYYAGFGNMDYTLERKRFEVRDSVRFVRNHRALATGNGLGWVAMMLVPVVGWFLAPPLGTIAATKLTLEQLDQKPYRLV